MGPMFRRHLARWRGQILGWGVVMALLGLMTIPVYDAVLHNPRPLEDLLRELPPEVLAFSGWGTKPRSRAA